MNNILVWSIFFIIALTLGLIIFEPNSQNNSDEKININNYVITERELNIAETIIKKKNLAKSKNIDAFDKNLRKILFNNLKTNQIKNTTVTQEEIIQVITNDPKFKKKNVFDFNLYKKFLTENNISEHSFQKFIKRKIKIKKIKNASTGLNTFSLTLKYKKKKLESINHLKLHKLYRTQLIDQTALNLVNYFSVRPYMFQNYLNINNEIILNTLLQNEKLYKKFEILKINHLKINKQHKKYIIIKKMVLDNIKYAENILNNKNTKKNILITQDELNAKFKTKIYIYKNIFIKESTNFLHIIQILKHNDGCSYDYRNDIKNKYVKINGSILKDKFVLLLSKSNFNNVSNFLDVNVYTGHMFVTKNKFIMTINSITDIFFERKILLINNVNNHLLNYFELIKSSKKYIYNIKQLNNNIYIDYINKNYYII